jgi:hypothetical protein
MATFDSILKCSIGGTSFQLLDYSVKEEAQTKEGTGRTGTKVTIQGRGEIEASTTSAFGTAIGSTLAAMRPDGQDVIITGLDNVVEYALLAAQCLDGGPFVSVEIGEQMKEGAALVKPVKFTVNGSNVSGSGGGTPTKDKYTVETITQPDGLRGITYNGEIHGDGGENYFRNTTLVRLLAQYPAGRWVFSYKFDKNDTDNSVSWSVRFIELVNPLPTSQFGWSVDGEVATRRDRDEQMRFVEETNIDLLVVGDPIALLAFIRRSIAGVILKENFETTKHKEQRLRGSFTTLRGANGNDLLNWEQTLETDKEDVPLKTIEYEIMPPVFVQIEKVSRHVQRGSAIGAGRYPKEPDLIYDAKYLEGKRRVTFAPLNAVEKKREWSYTFVFRSPPALTPDLMAKLDRPAQPLFYNVPAPTQAP